MPGKRLSLDMSFTDTTRPIATDPDPILHEGSLFLIDPTNPQQEWAPGMPAPGSKVPNLAWVTAADAIGAGSADSLAASYANAIDPAYAKMERSGKGGLHGAIKHTTWPSAQAATLSQAAVVAYMTANPTHAYFISLWARITRPDTIIAAGGTYNSNSRMVGLNQTATDLFNIRRRGTSTTGVLLSGNRTDERISSVGAAPGPLHANGRVSALSGPPNGSQTLAIWQLSPAYGGNIVAASWILYRVYIEDMTVSGRSYADVDAIDHAAYLAAVETAGGRYYGDTYTDPATL